MYAVGDGGFSQQRSVHKDLEGCGQACGRGGWTGGEGQDEGWMLTSPDGSGSLLRPDHHEGRDDPAKRLNNPVTDNASDLGLSVPPGMGPDEMRELGQRGGE